MKKFLLSLISITILSIANTQALLLEFINLNASSLIDRFAEAHFTAPGNNFLGAFFRLPNKTLENKTNIDLNSQTKHCKKLIRGMYYNAPRGERLWPLDIYTLDTLKQSNASYNSLQITGGFYTACDENAYGIFGQITYDRSGTTSHIIAGTKLDYQNNRLTGDFADSFEYFNNIFPLGYIVDTIGGIGFVGAHLQGHECVTCLLNDDCQEYPRCTLNNCTGNNIQELFVYSGGEIFPSTSCSGSFFFDGNGGITGQIADVQRGISIEGTVGLSQSLERQERQTLLGNYNDTIAVINTPQINISNLINTTSKNAEKLCRGRKNYADETNITTAEKILCFSKPTYNQNQEITIDLSNTTDKETYLGKTLIIKNMDLYLQHSMSLDDLPLDIFVDHGNVFLQTGTPKQIQTFSKDGYPTNDGSSIVTSGRFLKGNTIINGLLLGHDGSAISEIPHKLYIHGKLNSLNTPTPPSSGRISQIESLFGTTDFTQKINFQNTFTRYCNPITGTGSDGASCFNDNYADSPIVIIGQNFPTSIR